MNLPWMRPSAEGGTYGHSTNSPTTANHGRGSRLFRPCPQISMCAHRVQSVRSWVHLQVRFYNNLLASSVVGGSREPSWERRKGGRGRGKGPGYEPRAEEPRISISISHCIVAWIGPSRAAVELSKVGIDRGGQAGSLIRPVTPCYGIPRCVNSGSERRINFFVFSI